MCARTKYIIDFKERKKETQEMSEKKIEEVKKLLRLIES